MDKSKLVTMVLLGILALGIVYAAAEFTQTIVAFNIDETLSYVISLPGETNVTSDPTAASAPTTNIYFNSTTGNDKSVEAHVEGGDVQADGTPIFKFNNIGTINITVGVYLNATAPTCITLLGNNTYRDATNGSQVIGVENTTVAVALGTKEGAREYYLWANFTNCNGGNHYRILYSTGFA